MKLAFLLSTAELSGGRKVFLEHARRLAARGHSTMLVRDVAEIGAVDAIVVTRYRDVLPAVATRRRVVHLIQGLDVAEGGLLRRWRKRRRVARAFAASTEKLVVARHLLERFPGARLAPNGVDLGVFSPAEAPSRNRRVVIAGRGPTKRIDLARSVLARVPAIEIVHLTSGLDEQGVASLLRGARAYLSTVSAEEGFDLVALEAMASGTACVLSGGGAHRELAPELVSGFDPLRLAADLSKTLDDPLEHARRVRLGLDAARRRSWDAMMEHVEAAYRDAVGHS